MGLRGVWVPLGSHPQAPTSESGASRQVAALSPRLLPWWSVSVTKDDVILSPGPGQVTCRRICRRWCGQRALDLATKRSGGVCECGRVSRRTRLSTVTHSHRHCHAVSLAQAFSVRCVCKGPRPCPGSRSFQT